jgi:hypothetical protein
MKILGFGDSFITPAYLPYAWINEVAKYFKGTFQSYGLEGTGSYDAYFQFKKHVIKNKEKFDVAIFAWSNSSRIYHPLVRQLCHSTVQKNKNSDDPIWKAADLYYNYLFDIHKANLELTTLFYWFDNYLKEFYPNKKFVHLWSFPQCNTGEVGLPDGDGYNWDEKEKFPYHIRWMNSGVEIRPALINLSFRDGWPEDLSKETRCHHMTPRVHGLLSKYVIDALENYYPGRLIKIP